MFKVFLDRKGAQNPLIATGPTLGSLGYRVQEAVCKCLHRRGAEAQSNAEKIIGDTLTGAFEAERSAFGGGNANRSLGTRLTALSNRRGNHGCTQYRHG